MSARYREYFLVVVFFLAIAIGTLPISARAQENVDAVADEMCNPVDYQCPTCGMKMVNGQCQQMGPQANMLGCVCQGPHTTGICISANKCKATSYKSQSGQGGGSPDSMLQQLMGQLSSIMQQLMKGDSGGSGSGSDGSNYNYPGCETGKSTSTVDGSACQNYYGYNGSNSTSNLLNSLGTGSSGGLDLLSNFFNTDGSSTNTGTNTTTNSNTNTNTNTSNSGSSSTGQDTSASHTVVASISDKKDIKPGTNASVSQNAFGSVPGIAGDIQVLSGNRVTILASNRDVNANRQTSGFWGFGMSVNDGIPVIYTQVCKARQWATNFISFIVPISYFDNLCASHGYAVGPPKLSPATPPPSPTPTPTPTPVATTTATSSAPQYLGPLKADIWASPATVSAGARASIFWSSSGAKTCSVTSNGGVTSTLLSGNASTLPLTKDTTFSIACQSATSSVAKQFTVKVQ